MTSFEIRAWIIFHVAKILRIKIRDLYDSYPYNPYSVEEIEEFYKNCKKIQ